MSDTPSYNGPTRKPTVDEILDATALYYATPPRSLLSRGFCRHESILDPVACAAQLMRDLRRMSCGEISKALRYKSANGAAASLRRSNAAVSRGVRFVQGNLAMRGLAEFPRTTTPEPVA